MSPHVSLGKKSIVIYLPTELVTEARRFGLNISRITYNALTEKISTLNGSTTQIRWPIEGGLAGPQGIALILVLVCELLRCFVRVQTRIGPQSEIRFWVNGSSKVNSRRYE